MKSYLTPADAKNLESQATNLRDALLIRLLSRTGIRISEALSLTTEDIDQSSATITIQHLKVRIKVSCPDCNARLGKSHVFCPKCGTTVNDIVTKESEHRKVRTLPIDSETANMIEDFIARGGAVARGGKNLLFGIQRHHAWRIVTTCAEKAGLGRLVNPTTGQQRKISPHRLRDAFATNAMKRDDSGNSLRLLQEHLGHSSFETTAKYRKVAGEEHREWFDHLWEEDGGQGVHQIEAQQRGNGQRGMNHES